MHICPWVTFLFSCVCLHVHTQPVHVEARGHIRCLLWWLSILFFERGSFSEPGAHLSGYTGWPARPWLLFCLPSCGIAGAHLGVWALGTELGSSGSCSNLASERSPVPSNARLHLSIAWALLLFSPRLLWPSLARWLGSLFRISICSRRHILGSTKIGTNTRGNHTRGNHTRCC